MKKRGYQILVIFLLLILIIQIFFIILLPRLSLQGIRSYPDGYDHASFDSDATKIALLQNKLFTIPHVVNLTIIDANLHDTGKSIEFDYGVIYSVEWFSPYIAITWLGMNHKVTILDTQHMDIINRINITDSNSYWSNVYIDSSSILHYSNGTHLFKVDLQNNQSISNRKLPFSSAELWKSDLTFSPTGSFVYLQLYNRSAYLIDTTSYTVAKLGKDYDDIVWANDGSKIALVRRGGYFNDHLIEVVSIPSLDRITAPVAFNSENIDGDHLIFSDQGNKIMKVQNYGDTNTYQIWNLHTNDIIEHRFPPLYPTLTPERMYWKESHDSLFVLDGTFYKIDLSHAMQNISTFTNTFYFIKSNSSLLIFLNSILIASFLVILKIKGFPKPNDENVRKRPDYLDNYID